MPCVSEETRNYGLTGGTLVRVSVVERSCFKIMHYAARENEWRCGCGASEPGRSVAGVGRRSSPGCQRRGRHSNPPPVISTNQLKNGNHIEVDGTVFKVLEFQHVKPGKGGAFVRTKLRRASDGNVIDQTFRAGEKFRAVRTEARKMPFLYTDGTDAHFMDTESYEQMAVPEPAVADALRWTKPNDAVDVLFIDGQPSDLQLPASVVLEVTQTDPGLRGDTASGGGNKPATLETGATSTSRSSSTSATA